MSALRSLPLAPSSSDLSDREIAFVRNYVENGGKREEAGIASGYSPASAKSAACRLLKKPLIQQAILRETQSAIGLNAVPALAQVLHLMRGSRSDYVKLAAAESVLNRAGFLPPQRVQHALDGALSVSISIGGSKTGDTVVGTHPHTGKSLPEPDDPPKTLVRAADLSEFSPSQPLDFAEFVEISTSESVVFPTREGAEE